VRGVHQRQGVVVAQPRRRRVRPGSHRLHHGERPPVGDRGARQADADEGLADAGVGAGDEHAA
jgi:hypothetical protein